MATTWKAPTWRMPNEKNQNKFESYSLDFDGISSFIDINSLDSSILNSSFSISIWFKKEEKSGVDDNDRLIDLTVSSNTSLQIITDEATSKFAVNFKLSGVSKINQQVFNSFTSTVNEWNQIVLTWDGTSYVYYFNGQPVASTGSSGIGIAGTGFFIGKRADGNSTTFFKGQISQISVFDYALSSTQIPSLYNSGSPINPMTLKPAPIAYYPLGGNASTGGDATNTLSVPNVAVPDASVFDFDASDSDIINTSYSLTSGNKTISFWFNSSYAGYQCVLGNANDAFILGSFSSQIPLPNGISYMQGSTSKSFGVTGTVTDEYADGKWHNFVYIYDGNSKIYIDGTERTISYRSGTSSSDDIVTITNIGLGLNRASYPKYTGKLSNVQAWNIALSAPEVTTLYNSGVPLMTGTQPQEANLKAWYKLDQSANWEADTAGNWQIPDAVSSYPQSFDFDGSSGQEIAINNNTLINGFTSATFSFWFKGKSGLASFDGLLCQRSLGSDYCLIHVDGVSGSNYKILMQQNGGGYARQDSATLQLNKWYHVCVTGSVGSIWNIYINGQLSNSYGSAQNISGIVQNTNPFKIGRDGNSAVGEFSNVQIFNTELPATGTDSVETLYNNGVPLTTAIASDNLKGWWKLDNTELFDGTNWNVENQKYPANWDSALSFDGSNDKIDFSSSIDLGLNSSISVWLNLDSGYNGILLGEDGYSFDYLLYPYSTGFAVRIASTAVNYPDVPTYLTAGSWHHLAVVRSGDSIEVFVDGISRGTNTGFGTSNGMRFDTIGAKPNGTLPLGGKISNLAGYNTTLDSTAIQALYNNGTPETSISSSPVSWWKLDNTTTGIQDSIGSNNGTNNGATKVNTFVSTEAATSSGMTEQNLVNNNVSVLNGESSGMTSANLVLSDLTRAVPYDSYSFNFDSASSDYIDCGNNFNFGDGTNDSPFSISAWINMTSTSGFRIFNRYDGSNYEYSFGTGGSNKLQFFIFDTISAYRAIVMTTVLNTGQWYHVAVTYSGVGGQDAQDGMIIYVDGVPATVTETIVGTYQAMPNLSIDAYIGKLDTSYTNGKISNVAIFDEALTSTEVLKLYSNGVPQDLSSFSPAPISWWSLGSDSYFNGSSWICPDLISTNNGTSVNMDDDALVGDAPNSSANGTSTNMAIDANLTGSAPNSSNNSFSVNMDYTDRETSVPS